MDPDENLREMREICASLVDTEESAVDPSDAIRLAELCLALDAWIKGGGFLPKRWASKR